MCIYNTDVGVYICMCAYIHKCLNTVLYLIITYSNFLRLQWKTLKFEYFNQPSIVIFHSHGTD